MAKPIWPGTAKLKTWRLSQKSESGAALSQMEAAVKCGIDQARYNRYERGSERPGIDVANRMAKATEGAVKPEDWSPVTKRSRAPRKVVGLRPTALAASG